MPSIFLMGVVGIPLEKEMCSGSLLTGPNIYLDMLCEGDVSSAGWELANAVPSKSRVSSLGVDRREVGVKAS